LEEIIWYGQLGKEVTLVEKKRGRRMDWLSTALTELTIGIWRTIKVNWKQPLEGGRDPHKWNALLLNLRLWNHLTLYASAAFLHLKIIYLFWELMKIGYCRGDGRLPFVDGTRWARSFPREKDDRGKGENWKLPSSKNSNQPNPDHYRRDYS
jgi:hypothetical protein